MRPFYSFLLALVVYIGTTANVRAGDIKVIANPSVDASAMSSDELKGIFLLTKTSIHNGSHVVPVLLKSGASHETFVKEYLGKTGVALEMYYRSLVFTGKASMPKMFGSDSEMAAYVAATKGAIGYISSGATPAGVKTIEVK
jgi:ABC-type phosphate transport system substrate-binding protein